MKGGRGGSKKKATSRSAKAGLQFPVGRVHRHIKLGCREDAAAAPRTYHRAHESASFASPPHRLPSPCRASLFFCF